MGAIGACRGRPTEAKSADLQAIPPVFETLRLPTELICRLLVRPQRRVAAEHFRVTELVGIAASMSRASTDEQIV